MAVLFTLARLLGIRQEPEMVKVRHILISTAQRDPQNPQQMVPVRDSVVAMKLVIVSRAQSPAEPTSTHCVPSFPKIPESSTRPENTKAVSTIA